MGDTGGETQVPAGVEPTFSPSIGEAAVADAAAAINVTIPSPSEDASIPPPDLVKPKSSNSNKDEGEALTDVSADEESPENDTGNATAKEQQATASATSTSKKTKSSYKYDPDKITLRFLFANRDGLAVNVECKPSDTIGEVKGALLSVWPEDMSVKTSELGGDNLRLICMGKGFLMPDTRTLEECQVPVFKTHATPINVSIKPQALDGSGHDKSNPKKNKSGTVDGSATGASGTGSGTTTPSGSGGTADVARQGCCVIL